MKITTLGVILALKNLGTWLATLSFTNIREDPALFFWLLLLYALINVPSDLYLMNHATDRAIEEHKSMSERDPSFEVKT